MKKTPALLCLVLLPPSAFASEHIYSSLQLGQANHKISLFDEKIPLDIKPIVIGINTAVLYGEENLKFGYNANINFMYDEQTGNDYKAKFNAWSADISPLISYHLTDDFNIYSKIGLSYTSSKYEVKGIYQDELLEDELDDKSLGLTYGLGFNYVFPNNLFLGIEYKVNKSEFKYVDIDDNSFLLNIGIKM